MARFEFDSLEDFQAFAAFCGYEKAPDRAVSVQASPLLAQIEHEAAVQQAEAELGNEQPAAPETTAEKPKRKRRLTTDAASAAAQPNDTSDTTSVVAAKSASPPATNMANPFAASGAGASTATQAILAAENQQQATLAGIAAMQEGGDEGAPNAEPMTAPQHMHLCRQFIAKHGQQNYMEAFQLAGLSASIAAYTPEQRATHAATLAALDL